MNRHQRVSLTDEKEALLARMQASRGAYQRMLLGQEEPIVEVKPPPPANAFPKSKTISWIRDHPYLMLAGVAAAILATQRRPRQAARTVVRKGGTAAKAFSRNHQTIQAAIGIVAMLARAAGQRRRR
ncbi:hypothetical protein EDC30_11238 [Paucimonas lemoignei]|uniref:Uncharacterized protein n=1 Tax=Paucimonas lemoignei TaxID=29443 RepID=A0A4R3HQH4_PAULE|nr:hypothetical protein [Paucimonas lemoignei]TCS34708.1 hypothetical protein EDC30_11238 [Paucimonas lemoignei]